jgi:predicted amidohydrolase YtcJ
VPAHQRWRARVANVARRRTWLLTAGAALLGAPAAGQEAADLVVHNGKIFTADNTSTIARAVAVRDGRIIAVGGEDIVRRYRAARLVDLHGRLVVPGFHDTHIHIRGNAKGYVDVQGVRSIAELQARLRAKAAELAPGEWITGYGWSEDELAEKRKPVRADLDAVTPRNPAVIQRAGGHSAVINSLALRMAGVTRATPDPPTGLIEKDASGEPTGIIRENWETVARLIPAAGEAELRQSLEQNLQGLFALGITSIIEAMTPPDDYPRWRELYARVGDSLPRATVQIHIPVGFGEGAKASAFLRSLPLRTGQGDEHLRVGALKLFVDGGFTGPAAWTLEPYRGQPSYYGKARLGEADLYLVLKTAHELGWQVGMHAIGDAAIKMAVDQLARVIDERPRPDHRHYLNHFTVMPPVATMEKMATHGIFIAQQPNFTYTIEGRYVAYLDGQRLETNNPLRTPLSHGIFMALGSDIMPIGPLLGIYAAVTRRGMSGAVYGRDERLTVPEALIGYTRNGAYLTFEEHVKGTLEVGKVADLVVLSEDMIESDPQRILTDVHVDLTVLGGRVVYERTSAKERTDGGS